MTPCARLLRGGSTSGPTFLHGTYDYRLVALSVLFSVIAAYAALDLVDRVAISQRWTRVLWLATGATAMGTGIWAMHYMGMLAFQLPVPVLYHYPTVIVSLIAAIVASAVALFVASRSRLNTVSCIAGSAIMGGGIAAMHYIGMEAMVLPAMMEYDQGLVVLSVAIAIATSYVALLLVFRVQQNQMAGLRKLVSALILGGAIPLMHYTGMWAVRFRACDSPLPLHYAIHVSAVGTVVITVTTLVVMFVAMIGAVLDRQRMERTLHRFNRRGDARFQTLAEAIPQIVWIADADGKTTYINKRWSEMTGQGMNESAGTGWIESVHPDDRGPCNKKWQQCVRLGETFEIEYRLHDAARGYRWYLDRAVPLRDDKGAIQQWFGTCTDIEEQKHYQQILEQLIKERTEELADANTRLHQEMWEKDAARRTLDEQNEKMMQELKERSQRATLLAKMGEIMQSCLSKDEVFNAALGFAPQIFPTRRGAVALLNAPRTLVEVIGQWQDCGLPAQVFEPESCWALRTGHPHLVRAGDTTACCSHATGVKNSYLCVPILAQGEAIGILHFQATDEDPSLSGAELSFNTTFAGQVGLSVANIRLRDALRAQSIKDPLTGLYNRRYLEESLDREIRRATRSAKPLGILMLDLDHFKKFNDTYGHDAGDAILKETAAFLTRSIRAEDIVCRHGGEEFVVILPTADLHASQMRAERIRSKLRDLVVLHQGHSLGTITVSVGVAAVPEHGSDPKALLQAADSALYRAKREGRDRVAVAEDISSEHVTVGGQSPAATNNRLTP